MNRALQSAAALAAVIGLGRSLAAQQCYENKHTCFSFAPVPESMTEEDRIETGLDLRSDKLTITGDFRFRGRLSRKPRNKAYAESDQQATRARFQIDFQATEKVRAFGELNFSETWAGSESYSDAQAGPANTPNFNGISQAFLETDDLLELGEKVRVGRSEYVLANGLVLGSCDFLQRPATFTGVWVSRNFEGHDVEVFLLDDYGPLQSTNNGTRYFGGTARVDTQKLFDSEVVESVRPYFLSGTRDGFVASRDTWAGIEASGKIPWELRWFVELAHRFVHSAEDRTAYRVQIARDFELLDGVFNGASLTHSNAEGPMHINPADFNSAGLLHQYGGAWRSNLTTNQLNLSFDPGHDVDVDITLLTLDRHGTAVQLGELEADILVGKMLGRGIHAAIAYGVDDEGRQVGYGQVTLFF